MDTNPLQMNFESQVQPAHQESGFETNRTRVGKLPPSSRGQASPRSKSAPGSLDKDSEQKSLLCELLWSWGYFVQPAVKLLHPTGSDPTARELTDVDVYGILMSRDMHIERLIGDCKTLPKKRISAINRAFWLKGVMEYLEGSKGIMVLRDDAEEDHKLTAKSLGIILLSDRSFAVFRDKLAGSKPIKDTRLFDPVSWRYFDSNLAGQERLESLLSYRRLRFWRDPFHRAARYTLMETRGVRSHLRPDQRHHLALVTDMVALYSLTLQGMISDLFPVYLIVDIKEELDTYLKSYLYGGRDTYKVMNSMYQQVSALAKKGPSRTSEDPESDGLSLPEWPSFLQLIRTLLEHPDHMRDVPRFFRWLVFDRILYPETDTAPSEAMPEISTQTMQLALRVGDYFCKATGVDEGIRRQLSERIGDAILSMSSA